MRKVLFLLLPAVVILCLSSCIKLRDITFFQSNKQSQQNITPSDTTPLLADSVRIAPGDVLGINIKSESTALQGLVGSTNSGVASAFAGATSFLVDNRGMIVLPYIGELKVNGLSIPQIKALLREKLANVLVDPYLDVNLISFNITILGEVGKQGGVILGMEHSTIVDAVSQAGGLTDHGNAHEIEIIRGKPSSPQVIYYDLTQLSSFTKPGFYLKPGDIVYVKPRRSKATLINITRVTSIISLLTIANTVILIMTFIRASR